MAYADMNPDIIMTNSRMSKIKLCDLGSALHSGSSSIEPTLYLVSRFYRALEVILGLRYGVRLCCIVMCCNTD
jgi:serine/threonine-protein kinase PRP4